MDNAATTFPKPEQAAEAIRKFITDIGANAGRSGHSCSVHAGRIIYEAREAAAALFNIGDPLRVIFTLNATAAINTALYGILEEGDLIVTSDAEHNSSMRPIMELSQRKGIRLVTARTDENGVIDYDDLRAKSKGARLVSIAHGNNVTGAVSDIKNAVDIAHENGAYFMTDAAQTAGLIEIDMESCGIDILCASGHKGLYGPQGTGIMILGENIDHRKMKTLFQGGTGSRSEEERQPEMLPDKFESGTANGPGIAGLLASIKWLSERGVEANYIHEKKMRDSLLTGLADIGCVKLYASPAGSVSTGTLSFNIQGKESSEVCYRLDSTYGIMTRAGLHCAPSAHRRIGTYPGGTVRLSVGAFTSRQDVDFTINAVKELASEK